MIKGPARPDTVIGSGTDHGDHGDRMRSSARQWRFVVAILLGVLAAALLMPADRVDGAAAPMAGATSRP